MEGLRQRLTADGVQISDLDEKVNHTAWHKGLAKQRDEAKASMPEPSTPAAMPGQATSESFGSEFVTCPSKQPDTFDVDPSMEIPLGLLGL